jgi:putative transposase
MIDKISPTTEKKYPTRLILKVAEVSSASWYGKRLSLGHKVKPGPRPIVTDVDLLLEIKAEILNGDFHSEGYKKIHARIRSRNVICGANRVYNLLSDNGLLAPQRPVSNGSSRPHDGTITTELPNRMWGTDGKQFHTKEDGWCWFFSVIDHCNDEILGWHIVKKGDRFAAMEPLRTAIKQEYGSVDQHICKDTGLFLRADHGTQYDSNDFQNEIKFLGLAYSPAFVRSPECNGVIERFHRTLQEQVFDINIFDNLEHAKQGIAGFIKRYNNNWLIHRLGLQSPIQFKEKFKEMHSLKSA